MRSQTATSMAPKPPSVSGAAPLSSAAWKAAMLPCMLRKNGSLRGFSRSIEAP